MIVTVSNLEKNFGPENILKGVNFKIDSGEKVALVGRNGTGKSTILRVITGKYAPDTGNITIARGAKVGYLKQEAPVREGVSVLEEAQSGAEERLELKARLDELEERIQDPETTTQEDLDEYSLLHEHFLEAAGYSAERDVRTVLKRMGFEEEDFYRLTDTLSGGEKTRLAIARLLLEEPDLLILDEPTNHLDLQATEWLEGWIRGYHGAILLVSHDRTFLETTAERVLELKDKSIRQWPGPFSKFLQLKAEDDARTTEVARRQEMELAKMDEYVRRFMNSQRTAQARGRLKQMEKLKAVKVEAPKADRGIKGGFGDAKRSGDIVLETKALRVGFTEPEEVALIEKLDWTVRLGERWGVIGENGAGKSTLIKTVMGDHPEIGGQIRLGSGVVSGYFTQDASDLDPDLSPLDVLVFEDDLLPADARNLLGRFLLSGDDVYRPVRTLSGGEKNKLSLARLTHRNPNLLVLDEPTNHLDMDSREALAEILRGYKGTLILISHDRWLLSQVTDNTLDVKKSGPVIYGGSYTDYRNKQAKDKAALANPQKVAAPVKVEPTMSPREISKEIGLTKRQITEAEEKVARIEKTIADTEARLANIQPGDDVVALSKAHFALQTDLGDAVNNWELKTLRLEELEAMQG